MPISSNGYVVVVVIVVVVVLALIVVVVVASKVMENYLNEYNRHATSKTSLDLVIFALVIEHISRIVRIIKQPNGHALLIGIGGTGRTSATKLAAFIADMQMFQIEITKKYKLAEVCLSAICFMGLLMCLFVDWSLFLLEVETGSEKSA
jgi:hypothetical protein